MNKISEHITWDDAIRSSTAKKLGISNLFNANQLKYMTALAKKIYEPLYKHFNTPIFISSFFRSQKLNEVLNGASNSQHLANDGAAIDLDVDGNENITNKQIFDYIKDHLDFDQLIWEFGDESNPDWVHVSYNKGNNRKEILKSVRTATDGVAYEFYK